MCLTGLNDGTRGAAFHGKDIDIAVFRTCNVKVIYSIVLVLLFMRCVKRKLFCQYIFPW